MGACCSKDEKFEGYMLGDGYKKESEGEEEDYIRNGEGGATVRLKGSSEFTSMFTQQGRKGINQDAMTVWENFMGEEETLFCAVFDGHGPSGHKVARFVRDVLPSKLCSADGQSQLNGLNTDKVDADDYWRGNKNGDDDGDDKKKDAADSPGHDHADQNGHDDCSSNPFFCSWKASLIKSFKKMDGELRGDSSIDSYCSGTTAVAIVKQGEHMIIANLGDSRAILCTRDDNNELVPVQLTVDMKPNLPMEAERIKQCKGRVFALQGEPDVFRVWMPEENCPGLAMARAFGDFCLKDYGVISLPEVSYRKLRKEDEFVVLATDGVWDVLGNDEVIRIVSSTKNRSIAARLLVEYAVRAWRVKYPSSKIDDCAVICLFLKQRPVLTKSMSEVTVDSVSHSGVLISKSCRSTVGSNAESLNGSLTWDSKEEWSALDGDDGVSRANSIVNLPRFGSTKSQWKSVKEFEDVRVQC